MSACPFVPVLDSAFDSASGAVAPGMIVALERLFTECCQNAHRMLQAD